MFTEYPEVFIEVAKRMENNTTVLNKDIDGIISQTIFETLSLLNETNPRTTKTHNGRI